MATMNTLTVMGYIDNGHCEHIIKLFNKNNLIYTINMTAKKNMKKMRVCMIFMDSIVSKIQNKFNIEGINLIWVL